MINSTFNLELLVVRNESIKNSWTANIECAKCLINEKNKKFFSVTV